jgi:hypothetical protein
MDKKISEYVNSVFEQPWWLDAVAPNSWKELLVKENGEIIARWPIVIRGNGIIMPKLTQTLGFWLAKDVTDSDPYYIKRKKITNQLLEQLPSGKNINIRLDHKVDYFLPMHWKHFIISPGLSYRFEDLSDVNVIYARFSKRVRENIKSATNKVTIQSIDDIGPLQVLLDKTFRIQNRKNPISKDLVRNIYDACKAHNAGKLLYAIDQDGNIHSGGFFVYDKSVCYYLMAGTDPEYRSSAANSLIVWEGIRFASTVSKVFDFEGSMIEDIEHFMRQFGGTPSVYYEMRKQNIFLEIFDLNRTRLKKLIGYKI